MKKVLAGHDPIHNGTTSYYLLHDSGVVEHIKIKNKMGENKPFASKEQIDALDAMNSVRVEIAALIKKVTELNTTNRSREKSIIITKLEEANHWVRQDIEENHQL